MCHGEIVPWLLSFYGHVFRAQGLDTAAIRTHPPWVRWHRASSGRSASLLNSPGLWARFFLGSDLRDWRSPSDRPGRWRSPATASERSVSAPSVSPTEPPRKAGTPTSLSWFEGVGITLCMRLDHQLRFIVDVPPVGDLVLGDDPVAPCLLGPVKSAVGTGDEPRHPLAGIVPPDPDGNVDLP